MAKHLDIAGAIRLALEKKKLSKSAFARAAGVERQTVYDWLSGKSAPNRKRAPRVARVLGLPLAVLSGDPSHTNVAILSSDGQARRRVPLLDWVNAGRGAEVVAAQPVEFATEFTEILSAVSDRAFALRVQGDSMEPIFREGDVIVVDPEVEPRNGDSVVVQPDPPERPRRVNNQLI